MTGEAAAAGAAKVPNPEDPVVASALWARGHAPAHHGAPHGDPPPAGDGPERSNPPERPGEAHFLHQPPRYPESSGWKYFAPKKTPAPLEELADPQWWKETAA